MSKSTIDWHNCKLNELGFVGRGKSKHRPRNAPFLYGGKYPFFQTGDIKAANFYLTEFSQTYNEKGLAQSKIWETGTLCITIAANIADTAILGIPACFPDSVVGFVADQTKADVRFIKYSIDILKIEMQGVSHGTTQDNLSLDKLLTFNVRVPPLSIQTHIAEILSAYDDLIENNQRRIKILEQMARALYRQWFVDFRFPGYENAQFVDSPLGKIPEGWEVKAFGELYSTSSGGTPNRGSDGYYNGDISWIKSKELNDGFILDSEEKITELGLKKSSAKMFPKDSVIIAIYGATIGKLGILTKPSATNQACVAVLPKGEIYGRSFAFFTLLEKRAELINLAQGAAQQNISQVVIKMFPVISPNNKIVKEFEQIITTIHDGALNLKRKNANLRRTRDLLLPRLLSGQLDVSTLRKEPLP